VGESSTPPHHPVEIAAPCGAVRLYPLAEASRKQLERMQIIRFKCSWYGGSWPGWRVVWCLIVVLVLVLGFAAGYGDDVVSALATTIVTVVATEMVQAGLRGQRRSA
jgi:hypothetical protein